ncbi:MAG: NAD kinase [Chitinophagales bacterium]|nr:NAD kinase [Chitinophagales bacterium]
MQVVVYGKQYKDKDRPYIQVLFDALYAQGINTYVYTPFLNEIREYINFPGPYAAFDDYRDFKVHRIDVVIVLGGDGTMLGAVTLVRDAGVPMLGINLGRLGFLSIIEKKFIEEAVTMLVRGQYAVEERTTLYLECNPELFGDIPFALNDCTLLKRDTSSMITIHTFLNGDYLNTYWADGIIIATPTGSTGYSLSCGGPVVFPGSGNFVITPVAPHNLNVRPIVISDESVISFEVEGRADNFICTLDSRFELIGAHTQLAVRKNDFKVKLALLQDHTFLRTIREKLTWGQDARN